MPQSKLAASTEHLRTGGHILADQLRILGADKIFCVPGESFLGFLDGLYQNRAAIETISCRHETGAANMADAYAKLTGRPGICAVTRGPGATNAANGIHTAFQDSTPVILLIGQVGRDIADREAFQEMDYRRVFGEMAKWVAQIDRADRIPEYLSRAWTTALSGRPGPVVLALPEDMLADEVATQDLTPPSPASSAPTPEAMTTLGTMIDRAENPLLIVGGPGWSADCARAAEAFAEQAGSPVATSFRCQDYVNNDHPNYVGALGIAPLPSLRAYVHDRVDLLIVVGARLGEMTTQGYSLVDSPNPQMRLVHIHPDANQLGQVYRPDLAIAATATAFFAAAGQGITDGGAQRRAALIGKMRQDYIDFQLPLAAPGAVNMTEIVLELSRQLPEDAIISNGAGNYTVWLHRFHRHRQYRTQLAPTSGSMGYGTPAAIAAKLVYPDRVAVSFAGDGCFLMTAQEMATAKQYGAAVIFIVINNGMYGTIRMHQERNHPGRVIGTQLENPDFIQLAHAYGAEGERVERTQDFPAALERARTASGSYLIEIVIDPEALTPVQSLSAARAQGQAAAKTK